MSFLGPTGCGKTTLMLDMLPHALEGAAGLSPAVRGTVLVMKPRDATVTRMMVKHRGGMTRRWPPLPRPRMPAWWALWPKLRGDFGEDDAEMTALFRRCLLTEYRRGNAIIVVDEVYGITHELGLSDEMVAIWSRGRSMGTSVWAATQRPAWVPLSFYSEAMHLLLWRSNDDRAVKRYAEIGSVNPRVLAAEVAALARHECVYVCNRDGTACVVY